MNRQSTSKLFFALAIIIFVTFLAFGMSNDQEAGNQYKIANELLAQNQLAKAQIHTTAAGSYHLACTFFNSCGTIAAAILASIGAFLHFNRE